MGEYAPIKGMTTTKTLEKNPNETKISNLPDKEDKEFKETVVVMLNKCARTTEEVSEHVHKDRKCNRNQSERRTQYLG